MSSFDPFLPYPDSYIYRQVSIRGETDYIRLIRERISPLLRILLAKQLINGFHFIHFDPFHLRLSSDCWEDVRNELQKHNLPDELEDCSSLDPDIYGGIIGAQLVSIDLEINSRQMLAIVENLDNEALQQYFSNNRYLHQTVHHGLIQFGMNNLEEVMFHLDEARTWYITVIERILRPLEMKVKELESDKEN